MPAFLEPAGWPLAVVIGVFVVAAVVIGFAGTRLSKDADLLADVTGWGEAVFGAVFLGASTSLPGIVTSVTAAMNDQPELAFSNALGGIAAQTVFLVVADVCYPRANLEHAAPSVPNMMQAALLVFLLALVLLGVAAPAVTLGWLHPLSILLPVTYGLGLWMISRARKTRGWNATDTPETVWDTPSDEAQLGRGEVTKVWVRFGLLAGVLALAGFVIGRTGGVLANETGLSQTVVGGLFTAVVTSLPELVTAIAAVRHGALTLAIGNVIGGNTFDVLFVAFADAGYTRGSIYHAVRAQQTFVVALCIAMTAVLLLGLLRREKRGVANIGFESSTVLLIYIAGFIVLFFWQ